VAGATKRQRKKDNARAAREAREAALRRQRQRKTGIRIGVLVALFAIVVGLFAVLGNNDDNNASTTTSTTFAFDPAKTYATISTNYGPIVIEMDTKNAPKGSARFIKLAKQGFYDGLTWHRASKDFVIQGGDPKGDGTGGAGNPIVAEVPTDHYPVGSLAAAKGSNDPAGTFDSQFFIVTGSKGATLPNDYARFGKVVSGIENAQTIEGLAPTGSPYNGDGPPTQKATIDKIVITEPKTGSSTTASDATSTTSTTK
jgi:cyclophilin family peptidyl-prolyl cis-trans isomerase